MICFAFKNGDKIYPNNIHKFQKISFIFMNVTAIQAVAFNNGQRDKNNVSLKV